MSRLLFVHTFNIHNTHLHCLDHSPIIDYLPPEFIQLVFDCPITVLHDVYQSHSHYTLMSHFTHDPLSIYLYDLHTYVHITMSRLSLFTCFDQSSLFGNFVMLTISMFYSMSLLLLSHLQPSKHPFHCFYHVSQPSRLSLLSLYVLLTSV